MMNDEGERERSRNMRNGDDYEDRRSVWNKLKREREK